MIQYCNFTSTLASELLIIYSGGVCVCVSRVVTIEVGAVIDKLR